jgi:DUF2934 family protein
MQLIDIFNAEFTHPYIKIRESNFKGRKSLQMARKRISEPEIAVSQGSGAAPARRKTAVSKKKHTPATSVSEPLADSTPAAPVYRFGHEDIAALAYSYWVTRGYRAGSPEEDWLRAERELARAAEVANA